MIWGPRCESNTACLQSRLQKRSRSNHAEVVHRARNIKISVTRARAHYFYYSLLFWLTLTGLLRASGGLQETKKKKTFQAPPTQEQTDMISGRKRENGSLAFTFIENILLILTLTRWNERLDITLKTQLNPFQLKDSNVWCTIINYSLLCFFKTN